MSPTYNLKSPITKRGSVEVEDIPDVGIDGHANVDPRDQGLRVGDIAGLQSSLKASFAAPATGFIAAEKAVPALKVAEKTPATTRNRRVLKTVVGALLVGAFGVMPVYTLMVPASVEAVLNARIVTLRAPIAGRVEAVLASDDAAVLLRNVELLEIGNSRADSGRLDELRRQRGQYANERTAIGAKLHYAETELGDLSRQIQEFRSGRIAQLEARKAELGDLIDSAALRTGEARRSLERSTTLVETGALSSVELARAELAAATAALTERGARHRFRATELELASARSGIFVGDNSNNDRPSSMQREESVRSEIAVLNAERGRLDAEIERLDIEGRAEADRFALLSKATLTAPVNGRIWERLVSPGEEVQPGQSLLRMIDCSTSVVTANVSESVYNSLMVGTVSRFVPADGGAELKGHVVNLTGFANAAANLAIEPTSLLKEAYRVTVSLDGPKDGSGCLVGRTGRVVFGEGSSFPL